MRPKKRLSPEKMRIFAREGKLFPQERDRLLEMADEVEARRKKLDEIKANRLAAKQPPTT